ncbi:alkaline phosphatase-like protein [Plenodomus tracheiphilus IPT5]|uniref:Alkaline phosphatase-like protein n=1 Tax=Plenodomus tracheiphilus IPT5 TaxID=1408161 RepID=A0A6A7ASU1_9PLEO|nr:alkaline phosphatase-like protein [Plenodomus tracheiphilus IPT5]
MFFNLLAPVQALSRPKNQFALFFVSYFIAKLLHLGSHASSLPILLYVLYFPTFLLQDWLLLVISKVFIYTQHGGQTSTWRRFVGGVLALFTSGCAASQIAFFAETGGEIQWMAAGRVLGGSGGLGLLLSGLPAVSLTFGLLFAVAWIITPKFYDAVDHVLERIGASFRRGYGLIRNISKVDEAQVPLISLDENRSPWSVDQDLLSDIKKATKPPPATRTAIAISFTTLTAIIVVLILQIVRPKSPPYAHMSGSIPFTLIEAAWFQPINSEFCLAHPVERLIFPFDRFTEFFNNTQPRDWMPRSAACGRVNKPGPPEWRETPGDDGPHKRTAFAHPPPGSPLHGPPPQGRPPHGPPEPTHRPYDPDYDSGPRQHGGHGHRGGYRPSCDPLKLSNLEATTIENLAESIKTKRPKIKNILLLTLESTRKDMFPLKKGSRAYNTILSTYTSPNTTAELDVKLARLTETAAFLSGELTGFEPHQEHAPAKPWKSAFKNDMGGVNVKGAITQAAYTLKSLVSSHCGVEPLPVDFTEETKGRIYQACLPQILEQLTKPPQGMQPHEEVTEENIVRGQGDYRDAEWSSAFIQSVTDQFDNQDVLNDRMGFKHTIAESHISNEQSKHYPPKQPWVNYFGFPETETLGYLRDLFVDGMKQNKRVFASHLTSSPHHPFATPKDWTGREKYLKQHHWRPHDPFDEYLNTIKYQDDWISDIFEMLHDVGALEDTLVVITGDHGLAFNSVDKSTSAVNNGHVSNFAVPLLFIHPDLPRIQVSASTTQMSIIPTILDLLVETNSLSSNAAATARALLPLYQGNSLIRNLDFNVLVEDGAPVPAFFQPFHFSAINPGGSVLAIADASTTFRLILPLCSAIPLRFTDLFADPGEIEPIIAWTMDELIAIVKVRHGVKAKDWVILAEELGRWWVWNQRSKWGYWGVARSTGRGGAERSGRGQIKHKHWWETR